MPHISFEYSAELESHLDLVEFCELLRDTMVETEIFPLGGIRVRGHRVDCQCLADGDAGYSFLDMTMKIGQGRTLAQKEAAIDLIYGAAETHLRARIEMPFALSLSLQEMDAALSRKSFNTVHAAVGTKA